MLRLILLGLVVLALVGCAAQTDALYPLETESTGDTIVSPDDSEELNMDGIFAEDEDIEIGEMI
jgi:hypothetical protein